MGKDQLNVQCLCTIDCNQGAVRAVRFNVDGSYCLTCGSDRKIKLWNPYRNLLLKTYYGHGNEVLDCAASCDSSRIISASADKSVIIWDVSTGQPLRRLRGHAATVTCIKYNEESSVAISGSLDNAVMCWDVNSRRLEPIQVLNEAKDCVTSIAISNAEILTGSVDCSVRRYDLRNGSCQVDFVGAPVVSVSFSNDGQCLLVSTADNVIRLLDKNSGELLGEYTGHRIDDLTIQSAISTNDTTVLSGSVTGELWCWDLINASVDQKLVHTSGKALNSLSVHPKKDIILTSSVNTIKLWGPADCIKKIEEDAQILVLYMLSLIPWPGPTIFKISCPKDNARIVRKIIENKWIPVLEKYKVSIPLECPFHPLRDIFGPQEAAKQQHRPSQWTCGLCGKSFFEEKYLDLHFDNRHKGYINMAEDAVCLADYCDIIRCDVLKTQDEKIVYPDTINTDIEIWRETSTYRTELVSVSPREVVKYKPKEEIFSPAKKPTNSKQLDHCQKFDVTKDTSKDETNSNDDDKSQNTSFNGVCQNDLVDSSLPGSDKQQRIAELQKLKANCKPEELQLLKTKCEILVRDCIASLLIQLSTKDFKEIEEELNRAVCWYLTCDRYWEDSQGDFRQFPWGLICMIVMVLSLGICICYYIIWVLFDTDDVSVTSASMTDRSTPSPAHVLRHDASQSSDGHQQYNDDYYGPADKENEYIYVTYPPDLKRRLLESCYNRTTRL